MEERWDELNVELAEQRGALSRGERALKESVASCEAMKRAGTDRERANMELKEEVKAANARLREMEEVRGRAREVEGELAVKVKELRGANGMLQVMRETRQESDGRIRELEGALKEAVKGGEGAKGELERLRGDVEGARESLKAGKGRESALMDKVADGERKCDELARRMGKELEAFTKEGGGMRERVALLEKDLLASQAENSRLFDENMRVTELLKAEKVESQAARARCAQLENEAAGLGKLVEEAKGEADRVCGERDAMMAKLEMSLRCSPWTLTSSTRITLAFCS